MLANNWKQNLQLEPRHGWLNDPNGLAYFNGKYHIFHQYSYEVNGGLKHWYYYTSSDLETMKIKVFSYHQQLRKKRMVFTQEAPI